MAEKHHRDWKPSTAISSVLMTPAEPSDPGRLRSLLASCTAPVLICLVIIGFFWKLVLTNQFTWLASDDLTAQVMPWLQFQASEWRAGRFPLWDPYIWTGQPLLGQAQPGSVNPLHWLLFLVPLKNTWLRQAALHWHYVLIRILAALAFYWLCRDLGRSRSASALAAVIYGTAGYVGSTDWPQIVSGAVPAPLVFLFQFRAARALRPAANAILSGFFLGLTWLSGHHQLPLYITIATSSLWIYFILVKVIGWRFTTYALGTALLVSAVQTLPTAEYGRLAVRWSGADHALEWHERVPYAVHQQYSLNPLSLWSIAVPGADLNTNPFLGGVALVLVGAGIAAAWHDTRVRIFCALMLGSIVFALGPASFIHGLLYATIPLIEKARVPSQALILFHIGACGLVAWGFDLFPALPRRRAAVISIAAAVFGTALAFTGLVLFLARVLPLTGDSRFMVTAFASVVAAVVLWAYWRRSFGAAIAAPLLLGLSLLEIGNTGGNYLFANYTNKQRTAPLRRMSEDADIIDYLRRAPGHPFRIDYDGEAFPHNIGDWWGVEAFSGYVPSAPHIVIRNNPYNPRVQAMMGVRYYLGTKPLRDDQREVFTGASGRKVFRNATAFPRAWAVHSTTRVNPADAGRLMGEPSLDLGTRALVTREHPPLESCTGDNVQVARHEPDRVSLTAKMKCRGMVILSDTYFPGWRASVDGSAVQIYDTNGFVRGVIVETGDHQIEMVYRPWSVIVGAVLTLIGCAVALLAWLLPRRRARIR